MIIVNGNIFGEDGKFRQGNLSINDDIIIDVDYATAQNVKDLQQEFLDASGMYVIPGLVDIHLHGCAGYDFCDGTAEAMDAIVDYEVRHGITSIVPATMTLPETELLKLMEIAGAYAIKEKVVKGITMEGPFISNEKKGAQNGQYIQEVNAALFHNLQKASGGKIKQIAIAPEQNGALEFIKEISAETVVSVAHTEANYKEALTAFNYGANHVTHLYNAMPPLGHREPGVIGAAFDNKDVFVELICDGEHVHPSVIRATFQMFGPHRICMISDSMRATGMVDGNYSLGGQTVYVKEGRAVLKNGNLAASISNLYDCLKRVVREMGIYLEDAIQACTMTPAKSLGLEKECGIIRVGAQADLLVLDANLDIKCVIKAGKKIKG